MGWLAISTRLSCQACHLLEVSLTFENGLVVEGEPSEADSPRVHMRPLAYFLPLPSATVGQVPAGALKKRVLERERAHITWSEVRTWQH